MNDQTLSELLDRSVEHLPSSDAPLADLLRHGRALRRRRRRLTVAGAAVVSLLVVVGTVVGSQRLGQHATPAADRPVAGEPLGPTTPPAGLKWVGVGRTVVAVPQDWPVVPGVYCGGTDGPSGTSAPYVTITRWHVVTSCPPQSRSRGSSRDGPDLDVEGNTSGGFRADLGAPAGSGGLTRRSLAASRTTLPNGWLAVPAGEPYAGVGAPTVTSETTALHDAGLRVVRRPAGADAEGREVTTDPEIGSPVRRGATVVLYDHGAVPSSATLSGRLVWDGWPSKPSRVVPHPGTVHILSADRPAHSVDQKVGAGEDGRWRIHLPPGKYHIMATSPGYFTRAGRFDGCSPLGGATRTVGAGEAVTVEVMCPFD